MNNKLALITIGIYLGIAALIYSTSVVLSEKPVRAAVFPSQISTTESIVFSDSTDGAKSIVWEFGNGEKSVLSKGSYQYKKEGKYLVRLSIDNILKKTFEVSVIKPAVVYKDTAVFIYANTSGIARQKNHFKAMGNGIEWCEWYFGETGKIDARSLEAFYSFKKPGSYEVKLLTNLNPKVPQLHKITISDSYRPTAPAVVAPPKTGGGGGGGGGGNDLVSKLQAIAKGDNFQANFNDIVSKHLCSNPHTPVLINGSQTSDFYSYCMSLQIKSGTVIESAVAESNPKNGCAAKLIIKHK